ncbi:DUF5995 family protein [Salsipaludibacter albus]|uniref:DUF5995 family protein n=1 Tax=Salsipaludibacter albus TaxID=2849650 RepID=UPI001EE47CE4|nr:DUF5995 family protein [Salsipaludibacter albus]MBY5163198.1 hypothetical protein [Salsipaludibacter albus]
MGDRTTARLDELVGRMDERLEQHHADDDLRRIFLTVYRSMTQSMQASLDDDLFLDRDWTRDLTLRFAETYFDADDAWCRDGRCATPWEVAFRTATSNRHLVVEHALLGINAHIVYDLPRAVAATLVAHGDLAEDGDTAVVLARRRFDYDAVNHVLARTVDRVQDLLADQFSPTVRILDAFAFRLDEYAAEALLRYARTQGWHAAVALASCRDADEREVARAHLERLAADYAARIDVEQFVPTRTGRRLVRRWREGG